MKEAKAFAVLEQAIEVVRIAKIFEQAVDEGRLDARERLVLHELRKALDRLAELDREEDDDS